MSHMRTPRDVYEAYRIMPNLQEHQLRVAAVSKMICDTVRGTMDENAVILAALFHDMGNILKFDLTYFKEFTANEGVEYWRSVKADFAAKFGSDHHAASVAIARQLGLSPDVVRLISRVTFLNLREIRDEDAYEQKIVDYADLRVGPHGVVSMQERLAEARARYKKTHPETFVPSDEYAELDAAAVDIERQLFEKCTIRPEDINDTSIAPLMEELWKYPVP